MTEVFTLLFTGFFYFSSFNDIESLNIKPSSISEKIDLSEDISADSVLVIGLNSGVKIFEKNPYKKRPIASLTKIMTAILISEKHNFHDVVTINDIILNTEGSKMHLLVGEKITVGKLLYGMMIASGNDAALALSYYSSQSLDKFIYEMNNKAYKLGIRNTNFEDPHGLSEKSYSTAFDVFLMSKYFLNIPEMRNIINIQYIVIFDETKSFKHILRNTNRLLGGKIYGLKTGTTDEAGECLVLLTSNNYEEVLIIILGSLDRYGDAKKILKKIN